MFIVTGGVYENTEFVSMVEGSEETYGPFATYEEALDVWSGAARQNIDICCHRLTIRPAE